MRKYLIYTTQVTQIIFDSQFQYKTATFDINYNSLC